MPDHTPRLSLTEALAQAVEAQRRADNDVPLLDALQVVVDECHAQLVGVLHAAISAADQAQQRLSAAQADTDPDNVVRRHAEAVAAMAHLKRVAVDADTALQGLSAGMREVTGPAVTHLADAVRTTQDLIAATQERTSRS